MSFGDLRLGKGYPKDPSRFWVCWVGVGQKCFPAPGFK